MQKVNLGLGMLCIPVTPELRRKRQKKKMFPENENTQNNKGQINTLYYLSL
jgi:hypothetical protein